MAIHGSDYYHLCIDRGSKKFFVCVPLPLLSLFFFRALNGFILTFIFGSFYTFICCSVIVVVCSVNILFYSLFLFISFFREILHTYLYIII